jgi:hypothetical protein
MEKDNRSYHRIPTECPALYRIIDPKKNDDAKGKWGRLAHLSPISSFEGMESSHRQNDHVDPFVLELFLRLDWRMNYLIKMMTQKEDLELFPCRAVIVDISASGMKIFGTEIPPTGTSLEFQFVLPIIPFKELFLIGKIIRTSPKELTSNPEFKYEIAIEFEDLKEMDREHLIHYVVKRELQLRQSREKRS